MSELFSEFRDMTEHSKTMTRKLFDRRIEDHRKAAAAWRKQENF